MTWIACLTPPGRAAIATLAVHGPRAWEMVRPLFRPRAGSSLPETPVVGRFWLGRLGADLADDVVLAARSAEAVEVHCHGGREVVRLLLDLFERQGAASISWAEHLARTSADPLRAQAAMALTRATTTRTAGILLDQYHGALAAALDRVRAALQREALPEARTLLGQLARYDALGRRLTTPWRVVIAGAPNVGKSSLVNALAGYQRSVVAPTPGTTRDVVTSRIAINGFAIELADTAGLRPDAESLEELGIEQARARILAADLVLWVLDASTPAVWPDIQGRQVRVVVNKVDLVPAWDLGEAATCVRVSAKTGAGLDELCSALSRWLVPDVPGPGMPVPFTPELCDRVADALRLLEEGYAAEALARLTTGNSVNYPQSSVVSPGS